LSDLDLPARVGWVALGSSDGGQRITYGRLLSRRRVLRLTWGRRLAYRWLRRLRRLPALLRDLRRISDRYVTHGLA
jgi:hypothetical protein